MSLRSPTSGNKGSSQISDPNGIGLGQTLLLFGGAALLLYFATHWAIPMLVKNTGVEPVLLWFGVASLLVFAPLLITGFLAKRFSGEAW